MLTSQKVLTITCTRTVKSAASLKRDGVYNPVTQVSKAIEISKRFGRGCKPRPACTLFVTVFYEIIMLSFCFYKSWGQHNAFSTFAIGITTDLSPTMLIEASLIVKRYAGECPLSESLSALFMRVCQPLPLERKASKTSASSRIPANTLGVSVRGLPPLGTSISAAKVAPKISGNASDAGRIRVKSSSVSSGVSSSGLSAIGCESIKSQSQKMSLVFRLVGLKKTCHYGWLCNS